MAILATPAGARDECDTHRQRDSAAQHGGRRAFADYKLSFSGNDADVNGGGTLETDIWTNHFILGLSYRFGGGGGEPGPY